MGPGAGHECTVSCSILTQLCIVDGVLQQPLAIVCMRPTKCDDMSVVLLILRNAVTATMQRAWLWRVDTVVMLQCKVFQLEKRLHSARGNANTVLVH